jgi:PiT family inorganic phosphate transporter
MTWSVGLVACIIAVALAFDFTNGMHDAANSVATIVSTRVLSPKRAVIWAAFFNFIAFLIFGTAVASTIGKGLIDITVVDPLVILGGLVGAIAWNLLTWFLGLPSSSSHSLMGGYLGQNRHLHRCSPVDGNGLGVDSGNRHDLGHAPTAPGRRQRLVQAHAVRFSRPL